MRNESLVRIESSSHVWTHVKTTSSGQQHNLGNLSIRHTFHDKHLHRDNYTSDASDRTESKDPTPDNVSVARIDTEDLSVAGSSDNDLLESKFITVETRIVRDRSRDRSIRCGGEPFDESHQIARETLGR